MASDNLNEVGKFLKKSSDTANYAAKKIRPLKPSAERTRDIFDSTVSFEMNFQVSETQRRISLDLEFNKPPPMSECLGTFRMQCEAFDGLSAGDHELQLIDPYEPGSLSVYVNGDTWPSSLWAEINPDNGTVMVTQLPEITNTVSICYLTPVAQDWDCSDIKAHDGPADDIRYDVFGAYIKSGSACEWFVPPFLNTGTPTNFCYHIGAGGSGVIDQYGQGDIDVNGGPIQPFGTPNVGSWGMPPTVWGGGTATGTWKFSFPAARLCGAFISGFGGMGGTQTTIDYQAGEWDIIDGSFGSGALVPLLPVVTDTITLHWSYTSDHLGLQFFGGIDFRVFMVWGYPEPVV